MGELTQREVRLLSDYPTAKDEFKAGAHQRVARALAEIIAESEGGKAIGLEGSWGSGKSSVIEITRQNLEERDKNSEAKKHLLFVFDAWAHQGDPTRRVFLDNLIKRLIDSSIVDKAKWRDKLEELRARRKTTIERKVEKLSGLAKLTVLLLPLLPIAYLLLSTLRDERPMCFWGIPVYWLGWALVAAPYAMCIFAWLLFRKRVDKHLTPNARAWRANFAGSGGFHVFNRQTDEVKTDQLVREDEATTVEFNVLFDDLLTDIGANNHCLIIVLDNLDRLPADQIRDTWAMMRNFFVATPGSQREPILKNVWLIVPFDREHIESVFESKGQTSSEQSITPGFIEKTFEIVLRVAPPLLSNWQDYLKANLLASFGSGISREQIHRISKLFDLDRSAKKKWVTPREIKSYVNSIAAQVKQWGEEIPFQYQALYVLTRARLSRDVESLKNASILDDRTKAYVERWDWVKYLAAAHYNVAPTLALEVLLADDILTALRSPDVEQLKALKPIEGFENVLFKQIEDESSSWAANESELIFTAAFNLDQLEFDESGPIEDVWQTLVAAACRVGKPIDQIAGIEKGLVALIKHSDSKWDELIKVILENLTSNEDFGASNPPLEAGDRISSLILACYVESVKSRTTEEVGEAFKSIPLPKSPVAVAGLAHGVGRSGVLTLKSFHITQNMAQELDKYFAEQVTGEVEPWLVGSIKAIGIANATTFGNTIANLASRVRSNSPPLTPASGKVLLEILYVLRKSNAEAKKAAAKLSNDGSMHGVLQMGVAKAETNLIAISLGHLFIDRLNNLLNPTDHPTYGNLSAANNYLTKLLTTSDSAIVEKVAREMSGEEPFPEVLETSIEQGDSKELLREIVRKTVELKSFDYLPTTTIVRQYGEISEVLGPRLSDVLMSALDNYNLSDNFTGDAVDRISRAFLVEARKANSKHYKPAVVGIAGRIEGFDQSVWQVVLAEESDILSLLFQIREFGEPVKLGATFSDALFGHVQAMLDGGQIPTRFKDQWPELPKILTRARREAFYKNVRDRLLSSAPSSAVIEKVMDLFGDQLLEAGDFKSRADDTVRVLIEPLLGDGSGESLSALKHRASQLSVVIKAASQRSRVSLSSRFSEMAEKNETTKSEILVLAKSLGVNIETDASDEE